MAKKQAKKPNPKVKKMTAKEQSAQFIKTAREMEVDETGKRFEMMFSKIVPAKIKD